MTHPQTLTVTLVRTVVVQTTVKAENVTKFRRQMKEHPEHLDDLIQTGDIESDTISVRSVNPA